MIRAAVLDDVPALLDMAVQFHASSGYSRFISLDKQVVQYLLRSLIEMPTGAVFVAESFGGELSGAILGMIVPHFIAGQQVATELGWWVDPGSRGLTGPRLLERFEKWAKDSGAMLITMIEPPDSPKVGALYERRGYACIEKSYMKAL